MKKITLFILLFSIGLSAFSQKINGQWRGSFDSNGDIVLSGSNNTEFVLEIEIDGTTVTGYSYSYFQGRKYYVICKLEGTYYKSSKSIKVVETERIKGNTPPDFSDCLQVHYLTYEKEGNQETLAGRWQTAPGQKAGCGAGTTTLIRRTLSKDLSSYKKQSQSSSQKKSSNLSVSNIKNQKTVNTGITKNNTKKVWPETNNTDLIIPRVDKFDNEISKIQLPETTKQEITDLKPSYKFEKRNTDILKTIQIENETFEVDLYDNGEIDGDSVSLFYNNKLILSQNRLSEKPITIILEAPKDRSINELTMYAENLGEIPPNTALMVIRDGEKRYEVRISSDLKNSGTIHFIHKPKTQ